jgi:predicted enzyme related to lactoylglutathione lyase
VGIVGAVGERDGYQPGTFCWAELAAVDPGAARAFYAGLFGWEAEDTTFSLGGRAVSGLSGREPDGGPPAWLSYVSVVDATEVAARARDAGATVVRDASDVVAGRRTAVLEDPTGAVFGLWEPKPHIGAGLVNVPGALCLNQLNSSDPERAARFYGDVFGWRIESVGSPEQPYWGIFNGPHLNGGMMPLPAGSGGGSHWLVYFATEDVDPAAARIGELDGRVLLPPMAVPGGRITVALDPQGAVFAVVEGRFDP